MFLLHHLILVTKVSLCDVVTEVVILHICSHQDGRNRALH
jgi:hypothetical protein